MSIKNVGTPGILAAGQSSTMTGTYSGQFVMEVKPVIIAEVYIFNK